MERFEIVPFFGICENIIRMQYVFRDSIPKDSLIAINEVTYFVSHFVRKKFPHYYSGSQCFPIGKPNDSLFEYESGNHWDIETRKYALWRIEIFKSIISEHFPNLTFDPETLTVTENENI